MIEKWFDKKRTPIFRKLKHPYNKIGDGPEGPEVKRDSEAIHKNIQGKTLISLCWNEKSKFYTEKHKLEEYQNFAAFLPAKILRVFSRGKTIIFEVQSGNNKLYMTNHQMMSGKWVLKPGNYSDQWLTIKDKNGTFNYYFDNQRKLGRFEFYRNWNYFEKFCARKL